MNYGEAMAYLDGAKVFGSVLGLQTMEGLLAELGDPHKKLKFVHIAGTNGKGSTAAYLYAMLRAAGYCTGLYISPYVQRFGERIGVDGASISEDEIAACMTRVAAAAERLRRRWDQPPTVFELVTAMGFDYFKAKNCEIVVLEVGLGGRLDATNVISAPEVAVITHIGLDHTEVLGDTVTQIAKEKGGIIKPGCDAVVYDQDEEILNVLRELCAARGARFHLAQLDGGGIQSMDVRGVSFDWGGYRDLRTSLTGLHQKNNAMTALKTAQVLAARGWNIGEAEIRTGLSTARCIGRLELLREEPVFLVDGAHNPQGVVALMESLRALFPGKKLRFLMGVLADKDYAAGIEASLPLAERYYAVAPPIGRALAAQELAAAIRARSDTPVAAFGDIPAAIRAMLSDASADCVLCAFGSLYQIAEIRTFFGRNE